MDASLQTSLFYEMICAIHGLYKVAPQPFKDSPDFYRALRAADKAKLYLEDDMVGLVEMEREDAQYWRRRWLAATRPQNESEVRINVAPTPEKNTILNPEDDDDEHDDDDMDRDDDSNIPSGSSSISIFVPFAPLPPLPPLPSARENNSQTPRPAMSLAGLTATPKLGPILPSPLRWADMAFDNI